VTQSPNTPRPGEPETEETGRPTVRDKRRIDPQTYQLRDPEAAPTGRPGGPAGGQGTGDGAPAAAGQPATAESSASAEQIEQLKGQLADRTSDLQRVQAEYVNYKRRVDRDRDVARAGGVESVLRELLPVLDSLRAAREHEELTGGFKAVADEVERLAARHGLEAFGEAGDPFDPRIHEALMHAHADGITGPTCVTILQPGYKINDRVLRPARVAVAEPEDAPAAQQQTAAAPADGDQTAAGDDSDAAGQG
jgi:molecular chaperone GrpE